MNHFFHNRDDDLLCCFCLNLFMDSHFVMDVIAGKYRAFRNTTLPIFDIFGFPFTEVPDFYVSELRQHDMATVLQLKTERHLVYLFCSRITLTP